jgi:hypothetical protein
MLIYVSKHAPERIVRSEGALMAMNAEGLRSLNEIYALPKNCTEANMRSAHVPEVLTLCVPRLSAKNENRAGLIHLLPGTKAVATSRMFVLPGGRLVSPYAANTYDMARDGAVEIEHIKIHSQHREVDGWVVAGQLQRVCCAMP